MPPEKQSSSSLYIDPGCVSASELRSPPTKKGDATQQCTMRPAHDQTLSQRPQSHATQSSFEEQMNYRTDDTDLAEVFASTSIEDVFHKTETLIIKRVSHQSPSTRLKVGAGHKSHFDATSKYLATGPRSPMTTSCRPADKYSFTSPTSLWLLGAEK